MADESSLYLLFLLEEEFRVFRFLINLVIMVTQTDEMAKEKAKREAAM